MNRDDILRMAREAGLSHLTLKVPPAWSEFLIRFAALVAAEKDTEIDILRRELALVKGRSHPGYILGMHWLASAYHRICAGEPERDVMIDYGYIMERDE